MSDRFVPSCGSMDDFVDRIAKAALAFAILCTKSSIDQQPGTNLSDILRPSEKRAHEKEESIGSLANSGRRSENRERRPRRDIFAAEAIIVPIRFQPRQHHECIFANNGSPLCYRSTRTGDSVSALLSLPREMHSFMCASENMHIFFVHRFGGDPLASAAECPVAGMLKS